MSENYFNSSDQVPTTIISDRQHEIQRGLVCANMAYNGGYDMASEDLPEYPESYQQMLARFAATLDRVAAGLLGKSECGRRVVVVLVTHGAGISAMQWAMARRPGANDVAYCAMLSGTATARTASPEPALTWTMEYPPPPNNRAGHQRPSL
ncbi:hypothetical protein GGI04_002425 [Coemansia thaxteri]|nr:hypothetical protein GGI04_002425 [Coemansia thaxteri]